MTKSKKSKIDTKIIFEKGNKYVYKSFVAFFLPSTSEEKVIIASKKVGNAVKRNKAKRRLRQILKLHITPEFSNYSVILLARATTAEVAFQAIIDDTKNLINKIKSKIVAK